MNDLGNIYQYSSLLEAKVCGRNISTDKVLYFELCKDFATSEEPTVARPENINTNCVIGRTIKMEPSEESVAIENAERTDKNIKVENLSKEFADGRGSISDNASSLMIDSEDDSLNENENVEAWRATERRLSSTTEGEIYDCEEDLGIAMENKNTQRKTDTDIRIFITYLRSINEFRAPELIQPFHLDRYLSAFFSVVKKHDGNEYEPASLRGMLCSVERYLKIKNYPQSVTRDSVFASTRNALKYKQQKLRELGKGSKKQPEPFGRLTLDKVNHLFSVHEMGPYTPMSVINTLCFLFIVHFRLRKAIDHKNLLWGDIKMNTDQNGKKYLIYEPVDVQNAIAHSKYDHHGNRLCIWETPEVPERDPIAIYKLYAEKRPQNMKYENSPFYLGITSMQPSQLQSWYRTCAMGVNKLSDLVRMIRDITGLPRATMNAPTEYILSESYGIVSNSKQERLVSTSLVPDTKHVKVFGQNGSMSIPDKHNSDWSDFEIEDDRTPDTNSCYRTNEDSNNSDETIGDSGVVPNETDHPVDTVLDTGNIPNGSNVENEMTLEEAKTRVQDVITKLVKEDIPDFKNWLTTALSDSGCSAVSLSGVHEPTDEKVNASSVPSFPCINLNIKISPDAISGNSPISVVADLVPSERQKDSKSGLPNEKRKQETTESSARYAKRLKDSESLVPINLSSGNANGSIDKNDKTNEKYRRILPTPGNTAVVHPRSDKTDNKSTVSIHSGHQGNEPLPSTTSRPNRLSNRNTTSATDSLGYIVPISYPYINPACFAQDPRMLINANVVPHMAHSGANSSYSFLQSSFRNIAKTANQEINNSNNRFG